MPNKKKGGRGGKSKEAAPKDVPKETPEVASPEKSQTIPQYDGPAADRGASPTSPRSPRSPTRVQSPTAGDPALDRPKRFTDICKNVDLAAVMYSLDGLYGQEVPLTKRTTFNTTGKEIPLSVNTFDITNFPTKKIYQYDVQIGRGVEKRIVHKKVWDSKIRKQKLGGDFIYDGVKLGWSLREIPELRFRVDLDVEQGRTPNPNRPNYFDVIIRKTKDLNLYLIMDYLKGNVTVSRDILECLSFLDHLLRETPSRRLMTQKRSFFSEDQPKASVGGGAFAYKGIYEAIRLACPNKLTVNIDVSNSCFFPLYSLIGLALEMFGLRDVQHLIHNCTPEKDDFGGLRKGSKFQQLHRLRKLAVQANYRGCPCPNKEWVIKDFLVVNAKQYTIDMKDPATGASRTVNIWEYFKIKYGISIEYWELPLVEMTKPGVVYPMEVLAVYRAQKYPFKLDDLQTASMIKFAVTRPAERMKSILESKNTLQHNQDPMLQTYGLKIADNMTRTKGRLLPNPQIEFGNNQRVNPGTSGRWDLRNKRFLAKNKIPLRSWGVAVVRGRGAVNKQQAEAFIDSFIRAYRNHGGEVQNPRPHLMELSGDLGNAMQVFFTAVGNKFNARPEFLLFIVPDRNPMTYLRIKKSCDCRFGVNSQVVQAAQVMKNNPQYISNVLMKVNAKLGGTTAKVVTKTTLPPYTMIIGADVSHSSPGSTAPSMAAMTVSADTYGVRYIANCQNNLDRNEIIPPGNIRSILEPLARWWCSHVGQGRVPEYVMYFRDGVSTGQYQQVLQTELPAIRKLFSMINQNREWQGKITVIICSKRHHIRAFPDRANADRNGNPLPGTLIERDVTSPDHFDFFLYSHTALQGTSRPVNYHVIHDEKGVSPNVICNLIYEHCYQYIRSTTSVSMFPAVYYAHLTSNRARHHENVASAKGLQSGPGVKQGEKPKEQRPKTEEEKKAEEEGTKVKPLLPIAQAPPVNLPYSTWYL